MKNIRKNKWIACFVLYAVFWILAISLTVYAEDDSSDKRAIPKEDTGIVDIQKIKNLDLSHKQKKFIESLIETPNKKSE